MGGIKSAPLPGGGTVPGGDSDLPGGGDFPGAAPTPSPAAPPPLSGPGILDGLSSGGLKLSAPVGPGAANDPGDVFRVESVLKAGDFLDRPPGRTFDNDTLGAIKAAQGRLNDDPRVDVGQSPLKLDGLVNPDGPTQAATRRLAGAAAEARRAPAAQPTLRQRIAAMTGDQVTSLERLAGGLRKVTKPGPVAGDIADAFRADGPGTMAEFTVVRDALAKSGTPEQVNNLTEGVRAELNPEDRRNFYRLVGGEGQDRLTADDADDQRPPGPKDDGSNPTFNMFRERLKPREGGFSNDPKDEGGPTQKGMSQRLLDTLNRQHPEWGLPKDSKDLKEKQIRGIYRKEFFDKPKIQKVEDIPGIKEQAPQLPEQLFDAGVLHGPKRAGQWLQQSLDQHLGTDLKVPDKNGNLVYDGNVGPKTRAAISQATKAGKIQMVNDAMVDHRADFIKKLPKNQDFPGWLPRANSFRIRK